MIFLKIFFEGPSTSSALSVPSISAVALSIRKRPLRSARTEMRKSASRGEISAKKRPKMSSFEEEQDEEEESDSAMQSSDSDYMQTDGQQQKPKQHIHTKVEESEEDDEVEMRLPTRTQSGRLVKPSTRGSTTGF